MEPTTIPPQKPKYKKKGPIRFEAIAPFGIVCGLIAAYFLLLFDAQLRWGLEWVLTRANGAEVNIGSLRTSFLGGSFSMGETQFTDPKEPVKNRLQIGRIHFDLLWDGLLRAKFVVESGGIDGIQVGVPRKAPGWVVPPSEKGGGGAGGWVDEQKRAAIEKLREKARGSGLADAAALFEGFDPQQALKQLTADFKTTAHIQKLGDDLAKKEKEWQGMMASLPGDKDVAALKERIAAVQVGGTKNPAQIASQVSQVQALIGEVSSKADSLKTQAENVTKDVGSFQQSIQQIDEMVAKDKSALEGQLKLPRLDAKNLATQMFAAPALDQLDEAQRYVTMARQYMPAKSEKKEEPAFTPHARSVGRSYHFGRPSSYPAFWLMKATVSSKAEGSPFGGPMAGEIVDVTSDPAALGRPTRVRVDGEFPQQRIRGVKLVAVLDHTKGVAVDEANVSVGAFPVADRWLQNTPSVKLGFAKATGSATLNARFTGHTLTFDVDSEFKDLQYRVEASSKILKGALDAVTKELPVVTVGVMARGQWGEGGRELDLSVRSNLADALQKGFEAQLQAQLAEVRRRIDQLVDERIGKPKRELTAKYDATRSKVTGQLEEKKKKVGELKGTAESKLAAVKNQASAATQGAVNAIKKKLPFGR